MPDDELSFTVSSDELSAFPPSLFVPDELLSVESDDEAAESVDVESEEADEVDVEDEAVKSEEEFSVDDVLEDAEVESDPEVCSDVSVTVAEDDDEDVTLVESADTPTAPGNIEPEAMAAVRAMIRNFLRCTSCITSHCLVII